MASIVLNDFKHNPLQPEIRWVNHASFVLSLGDVRLMTDPWLEGFAFHDSWSLLSPTWFDYSEFQSITHLWISHEHPDHFSPAVLRKIAPEHRAKITVLYQKTRDRKIRDFCRSLGFKEVLELEGGWIRLGASVEVWSEPFTGGDSWIVIQAGERLILNINDCVVPDVATAEAIAAKFKRPVDVLMTQFSYASWAGNPEDVEYRRKVAAEKFDRVRAQIVVFRPKFVIPFASFVYFCHEDNFFMNDEVNEVGRVAEFIEKSGYSQAVVLYPEDRWQVGESRDSSPSIQRYRKDFKMRLTEGPLTKARSVSLDELLQQGQVWQERILQKNRLYRFLPLESVRVAVTDLGEVLEISKTRIRRLELGQDPLSADISMHSEALSYCFKFPWGMNTLHVSGRFRTLGPGKYLRFFRLFAVCDWNNRGEYLNWNFLVRKLPTKALAKFRELSVKQAST